MIKRIIIFVLFLTASSILSMNAQMVFSYGGNAGDAGKSIVHDYAGNIIVAGTFSNTVDFDPGPNVHSRTSAGSADVFIAKYNAGGNYLWVLSFGSSATDGLNVVKTDTAGNIYICGFFSGQTDFDPGIETTLRDCNGMRDAFIAKYDQNGNFIWVNTFGADSLDEAKDLAIDLNDNIYCIGYFQRTIDVDPSANSALLTSDGAKDVFIVKYNSEGAYQWSDRYGTIGDDEGQAIALDENAVCYASGYIAQLDQKQLRQLSAPAGSANNTELFILKYTATGSLSWSKLLGGAGYNFTSPGGICVDALGNLCLMGCFSDSIDLDPSWSKFAVQRSNGNTDIFVAKYTLNGVYQKGFSFGGSSQDIGTGIAVNNFGDMTVTGSFKGRVDFDPGTGEYAVTSNGSGGASDIFIVKYSSQGDFFWVNTIGASTSTSTDLSVASSVVFDNLDNCYVTGAFFQTADFDPTTNTLSLTSAGSSDIFMTEYDTYGHVSLGEYPDIEFSPHSIDFGVVAVDSIKPSYVNIISKGSVDLAVSSIVSSNSNFTVFPTTMIIKPGFAQDITINFIPTDTMLQTGWIILQHNAAKSIDSIAVRGIGTLAIGHTDYQLAAGWNMISLPLRVGNSNKNYLFSPAISDAYLFNGSAYQSRDTLTHGVGYWLKFDSTRQLSRFGSPVMSDTIVVTEGWNLIGSIFSPIDINTIVQDPSDNIQSSFFGYDGSYKVATIIQPGKAYWVKLKQAGKLILQAP